MINIAKIVMYGGFPHWRWWVSLYKRLPEGISWNSSRKSSAILGWLSEQCYKFTLVAPGWTSQKDPKSIDASWSSIDCLSMSLPTILGSLKKVFPAIWESHIPLRASRHPQLLFFETASVHRLGNVITVETRSITLDIYMCIYIYMYILYCFDKSWCAYEIW